MAQIPRVSNGQKRFFHVFLFLNIGSRMNEAGGQASAAPFVSRIEAPQASPE